MKLSPAANNLPSVNSTLNTVLLKIWCQQNEIIKKCMGLDISNIIFAIFEKGHVLLPFRTP